MIDVKSASPAGSGTTVDPYVFETGVTYQFWGPWGGWRDTGFENWHNFERHENWYISDCPMASWSKIQTNPLPYDVGECDYTGEETHWWLGYYEGSFSSSRPKSSGKHWNCYGYEYIEFYYKVIDPSPTPTPTPAPPVADFTADTTTGYSPLTVQFTDTSTGSTTSWSWSFGDGGTSTHQNPSYVYNTPGTYDVSLTTINGEGSDTEEKEDYISVFLNNYYVFADGVRYYHNYENNSDVITADESAQGFYSKMVTFDSCHEYDGVIYCWNGRSNPVNDDTGSKYWRNAESADTSGANSVEFAYHSGHGWEDGILFGTANQHHKVYSSDMSFSRAKWVVLDSCYILNSTTYSNWESVFDGLHILLSYDTMGLDYDDIGSQFVERMKGGTYGGEQYPVTRIWEAWRDTLQETIQNSAIKGAYMYADPCKNDYLPGFGPFEEPVENNGEYTIHWENFACI